MNSLNQILNIWWIFSIQLIQIRNWIKVFLFFLLRLIFRNWFHRYWFSTPCKRSNKFLSFQKDLFWVFQLSWNYNKVALEKKIEGHRGISIDDKVTWLKSIIRQILIRVGIRIIYKYISKGWNFIYIVGHMN